MQFPCKSYLDIEDMISDVIKTQTERTARDLRKRWVLKRLAHNNHTKASVANHTIQPLVPNKDLEGFGPSYIGVSSESTRVSDHAIVESSGPNRLC